MVSLSALGALESLGTWRAYLTLRTLLALQQHRDPDGTLRADRAGIAGGTVIAVLTGRAWGTGWAGLTVESVRAGNRGGSARGTSGAGGSIGSIRSVSTIGSRGSVRPVSAVGTVGPSDTRPGGNELLEGGDGRLESPDGPLGGRVRNPGG